MGLDGQTKHQAIIVENDLQQVDMRKPTFLFSQTTRPLDEFNTLAAKLKKQSTAKVIIKDIICRQVSNRVPHMKEFAQQYDVIIFVGGKKSSNAKFFFRACQQRNHQSYFISSPKEIKTSCFVNKKSVGICGVTSTPQWSMEKVAGLIKQF